MRERRIDGVTEQVHDRVRKLRGEGERESEGVSERAKVCVLDFWVSE